MEETRSLTKTEKKYHPSDTLNETLYFKDEDDEYFDPTSIDVIIRDPDGETVETLDIDDLSQDDTGIWILAYDLPEDAEAGTWSYTITAIYNSVTNSETFLFSVNPMPYGSLTRVRQLCSVDDDTEDDKLLESMDDATAYINAKLQRYATVPLSNVPDEIRRASNFLAASFNMKSNSPNEETHPYKTVADEYINEYIKYLQSTASNSLPIVIGKDTL